MEEVLTVLEVAKLLKVHHDTIYRMLKRGELPAFKVRSDWRFSLVQIEEWMRSRTQAPEGRPTTPLRSARSRTGFRAGPRP